MINHQNRCLGCLEEMGAAKTCLSCGYEEGTAPESLLHLPPETILQGKYLLGRALGQGGFGITYLAWDMTLKIKLAIKEYLPQQLVTRSADRSTITVYKSSLSAEFKYGLNKFLEEARTLARFNEHPNIVTVRDYFEANRTAYLVMNHHEGVTLQSYLESKGGQIPVEQAVQIFMPVLDALKEVHADDFLHRDISPDNLLIDRKGRVILIDFGAARQAMSDMSKSLSVIMKAGYSPPEQYQSKSKQGPWTDIYAVAATFYRAITGQPPPEAIERLAEDELIPPSQVGVKIDIIQENALLKALAMTVRDRYQTIEEFQAALLKSQVSGMKSRKKAEVNVNQDLKAEPLRGDDLKRPLYLSIEEAFKGTVRTLNISSDLCCPECNGFGFINKSVCRHCGGRKFVSKQKTLDVKVPAGVTEGTIVRLQGAGNSGLGEAPNGDLLLQVHLKQHPAFRFMSNNDLQSDAVISVEQANKGTLISVKTIDSFVNVKVPAGTKNNQKLRLKGKGFVSKSGLRGDHFVAIEVKGEEKSSLNFKWGLSTWLLIFVTIVFALIGIYFLYFSNGSDNRVFPGQQNSEISSGNVFEVGEDTEIQEPLGNTAGNIANGGLIAYHEGYLYFSGDNGYIYQSELDGSGEKKMNDDSSMYINVVDGWIYYSNHDDGGRIYKMRTDGSGATKVNEERSRDLNVNGDWIYYINSSMEPYESYYDLSSDIHRISTDGSSRSLILGGKVATCLLVVDDQLYYGSNDGIYRMNIDGTEQVLVTSLPTYQLIVQDDWVYFVTDIIGAGSYVGGNVLASIKNDGSSLETIYSLEHVTGQWIRDFNIAEGKVFFIVREQGRPFSLNAMEISGGSPSVLAYANNSWLSNINLVGNHLYYEVYDYVDDGYELYLQKVEIKR